MFLIDIAFIDQFLVGFTWGSDEMGKFFCIHLVCFEICFSFVNDNYIDDYNDIWDKKE